MKSLRIKIETTKVKIEERETGPNKRVKIEPPVKSAFLESLRLYKPAPPIPMPVKLELNAIFYKFIFEAGHNLTNEIVMRILLNIAQTYQSDSMLEIIKKQTPMRPIDYMLVQTIYELVAALGNDDVNDKLTKLRKDHNLHLLNHSRLDPTLQQCIPCDDADSINHHLDQANMAAMEQDTKHLGLSVVLRRGITHFDNEFTKLHTKTSKDPLAFLLYKLGGLFEDKNLAYIFLRSAAQLGHGKAVNWCDKHEAKLNSKPTHKP